MVAPAVRVTLLLACLASLLFAWLPTASAATTPARVWTPATSTAFGMTLTWGTTRAYNSGALLTVTRSNKQAGANSYMRLVCDATGGVSPSALVTDEGTTNLIVTNCPFPGDLHVVRYAGTSYSDADTVARFQVPPTSTPSPTTSSPSPSPTSSPLPEPSPSSSPSPSTEPTSAPSPSPSSSSPSDSPSSPAPEPSTSPPSDSGQLTCSNEQPCAVVLADDQLAGLRADLGVPLLALVLASFAALALSLRR